MVAIASLMTSMFMSTLLLLNSLMVLEDMLELLLASMVVFSLLVLSTIELEGKEKSLN